MTKAQVDYAERKAMEVFDEWNEITGWLNVSDSYYSEVEAIIVDAVHIGIQMAMFGKVVVDKNGNIAQTYFEKRKKAK